MNALTNIVNALQWTPLNSIYQLFDQGGWVLWVITLVAFILLLLCTERYWFLLFSYRKEHQQLICRWQQRSETGSWCAHRIRDGILAQAHSHLTAPLTLIRYCILVCPLVGLLGTVTGMISVFEVMAFNGTGNARLMAAGITQATIPTMAGMVVAITGLLLAAKIERLANQRQEQLAGALTIH